MRRKPAIIESVIAYSAKGISLKELSLSLNMSYSYLSRLIKRSLNSSYSCLRRRLRTQRALALLAKKENPIKEVVGLCGYKSTSHFYKDFKALVGCTPGDFRARTSPGCCTNKKRRGEKRPKDVVKS